LICGVEGSSIMDAIRSTVGSGIGQRRYAEFSTGCIKPFPFLLHCEVFIFHKLLSHSTWGVARCSLLLE